LNYFEAVKSRIDKILATISLIFITLVLYIIVSTPPATGYELSIYDAYPSYLWLFLIAAIACGICILVHQAFAGEKSNWWLAGLGIVIFCNAIFLTLPLFRGYALYGRTDTMPHLGFMKDILNTGHIGTNYYPMLHLLGVSLLDITGISVGTLVNLLFILFSSLYLINMYLLATVVARSHKQALLITAFACSLIFSFAHVNIHCAMLSAFMAPLLLYLYHRREQSSAGQVQTVILLLLLGFFITFFHPVTTIFLIVMLLAFGLCQVLCRWVANRKSLPPPSIRVGKSYLGMSLIMFVVLFTWYFSFTVIQHSFREVYEQLIYSSGPSLIEYQLELLTQAGLTFSQTAELWINRFGAMLLYLFISLLVMLLVWKQSLSRKDNLEVMEFAYSIQLLVAFLFAAFYLFRLLSESGPVRLSRFSLIIGTVLIGLVTYRLVDRNSSRQATRWRFLSRKNLLIGFTILLILGVSTLSIFSVYNSPRVMAPNGQITRMDIVGTQWFIRYGDPGVNVSALEPGLGLEYLLVGTRGIPQLPKKQRGPPPSHFGYDRNNTVAETFEFNDIYIITDQFGRVVPMSFPENVRPKVHQYTEEDFDRLRNDPTVAQIYANGEFEVWRVYGKTN